MKRSLLIGLLLFSLVFMAGVPSVFAQSACPTGCIEGAGLDAGKCFAADGVTACAAGGSVGLAKEPCPPGTTEGLGSEAGTCIDSTGKVTSAATTDTAAAKIPTPLPPNPDNGKAFSEVMQWIMGLFAWLVGVASVTLDNVVYYTVVTMGTYVSNLSAVGLSWRILRDIGNIILIFGFLAIGIATIVNANVYGYGKKMLPKLLIAAVFLNFSLFMTEAVIDVGNLFATQFYTQINGGKPAGAKNFDLVTVQNEGISSKIMNTLGLQTLYNNGKINTDVLKTANSWVVGFMGILLFLITAFVLFSLAFILIARFVMLLFLIIVAPIGFAGLAVPKLESLASKWWGALFEQTITAPVLLLLLYIALAVITDAQFLTGFGARPDWTGFVPNASGTTNLVGFASIFLSFLVAMGLLLAVVMVAKRMSAFGAGHAIKLAGRTTGFMTFGAAALAGRSTLGFSGYLLNNKRVQARAAKGGLLGTIAKGAAFTGRNLEKRTFDVRNIPGVRKGGAALGGAIPNSGLEHILAGETKVTAKSGLDATREAYKTYKPFSGEWWRDQRKEYQQASKEIDRKSTLKNALPTDGIAGSPADTAAKAAQKELKGMSVDELTALKGIRGGIDSLVHNLSPEKFNELIKSDKLLPGEKAKIKLSWDKQFATTASASVAVNRLSTEEVASLGGGTLAKPPVIESLGPTELEAIRRKGSLDRLQRHDIYDHMTAIPGSPLDVSFRAYLAADATGGRTSYWNV